MTVQHDWGGSVPSARVRSPGGDVCEVLEEAVARRGLDRVLVCAPAGTGKTESLERWMERRRKCDGSRGDVYVTLCRDDNDVEHLTRRLQSALAGIGGPGRDGILVLDDAHLVTDDAALACLATLIESVPADVTVVVSARHVPALPWSKYSADGSVAFVGWPELALSRSATSEILAAHGCAATDDELDTVLEVTGGWAGAVASTAVLAASRGDVGGVLAELRRRPQPVSSYVVGEVLAGLPVDLDRFIRSTSVTERFTRKLAEDIGVDVDRLLAGCEHHGIPLTRSVVDGELTYCWHPLVRRHIRAELRETDPGEFARLQVVAARALADAGRTVAAFSQLSEVSDETVVEDFVYRYGPAAVFDGFGDAVLESLGARHRDLLAARLLRALVALEANDPNAARAYLRSARVDAADAGVARYFAAALAIEAAVISGRPMPSKAVALLENAPGTGNMDLDCYVDIQQAAALMFTRRPLDSERLLKESLAIADLGGHPRLVLRCLARLAVTAATVGNVTTMGVRAEHALRYAVGHGLTDRIDASQSAAAVCMCAYLRGDELPDDSPVHVLLGDKSTRERLDGTTDPAVGGHAQVAFAIVRAQDRTRSSIIDADAVGRAMLRLLARGPQAGLTDNYVSLSTAVLVAADRTALARDVTNAASEVFGESPDVKVARVIIMLSDPRSSNVSVAEEILRPVLESTSLPSRVPSVQAWVLTAVLAARDHRPSEATVAIRRALELAETDGMARPFMNYAADVAELLTGIRPGEGVSQQFLDHVRAKLVDASAGRNPGLTRTEKIVLAQLRTGKLLRLIAQDMHLSVNTVRTHARNLYRKLDATSREEAIEAAVRRGLL